MTPEPGRARFRTLFVSREQLFSLGRDSLSGEPYLAIPVANRMTDYEEYYRITPDQLTAFQADLPAARAFADQCRARRHDTLLILKPGADRGEPWQV